MNLTLAHIYNKNTSTCGMILTEYLLNIGKRPQADEWARKSPCNWVGKKKKKKAKKESGRDLRP